MGRPSLFSPKDGERSYHILALTKLGARLFEQARARLKRVTEFAGNVSDADTVEGVLRENAEMRKQLKDK